MQFEYFSGNEAEQFQFYRIPQILFTDTRFKKVSSDAKILYGLLLDRIGLSFQNPERFIDNTGKTFIYFTRETTMEMLNCGKEKAASIFQELEKIGLIERKRQGLGKPPRIYVKNFAKVSERNPDNNEESNSEKNNSETENETKRSEKPTARGRESRLQEVGKTDFKRSAFPDTNHTESNHTEFIHTESISQSVSLKEMENYPVPEMKRQTDRQTELKFTEVLQNIGCNWMPEAKNETEYCNYSTEARHCSKCVIPYDFKGNSAAMKYALQYLFAYSYFNTDNEVSDSYARLMKQVIECIAEMTSQDTYQVQGITVKYYEIIDRLNEINQEDSLADWFVSFEQEWKKILGNNKIRYEKAYMKSCIWNWLNEYQFADDNNIRKLDYAMKNAN